MSIDILKYWTPEGFEISSHSYGINDRKNKRFRTSGSDNSGLCVYTYNELGFRADKIGKEGFKIFSIGCSHTEGVGVNDWETWPYVFSKMVPNSVNLNFGTGGRSNDFISRCIMTYFDQVKPDLVLILYTYPARREYFTETGDICPFSSAAAWGHFSDTEEGRKTQENLVLVNNENENLANWYKNHLLIKLFLENRKCNWLWDNSFVKTQYVDDNKFEGNFNGDSPLYNKSGFLDFGADKLHSGPMHHKAYSLRLIDHILKEYPHFLPSGSGYKMSII